VDPRVSSLRLPEAYGKPSRTLSWPNVRTRLEQADHNWLATTRPDGRPHVVPVDGLWVDDVWYFGGSAETVHQRNLTTNPDVVIHLADAMEAVIVEGRATWSQLELAEAKRLASASKAKYGYAAPPATYAAGTWGGRPSSSPRLDQPVARPHPLRLHESRTQLIVAPPPLLEPRRASLSPGYEAQRMRLGLKVGIEGS
jgi:pyridoxamine 5'-phosphate oxidase-like protein